MRRLAAILALSAAGCAAHTGPRLVDPSELEPVFWDYPGTGAPDSITLRWTAPARGTRGCDADTSLRLRDPLLCAVLRLRGQAPAWRPGCEASVACWDSVRRQTTPDAVARLWAMPGAACSVRVASGDFVVVARNAAGVSCWSPVKGGVR